MRNFMTGIVFSFFVLGTIAFVSIYFGLIPANADEKPGTLETWAAHTSLRATIKREMPTTIATIPLTDANIISGIKLYSANCAVCHGASDAQASNIATGLFQHAPQLARHGVTDDPEGKIYWYIKHGVRLTGMPSFSDAFTEAQIWQVTMFLKHMDNLTPKAEKAWKAVPSASL